MRTYFAILAAFLFAATSLASPVSAQSVPKPADQAQPSTRSDDDSDADEAFADGSGAQLDSITGKASGRPDPGCARDVSRFCRAIMDQDDRAILACLKQNRARLSKTCGKVLTDHGQ